MMDDKPLILIVDDTATNIRVLERCLKDDYRLMVATGGEQCLALARVEPYPDLILLDIKMPGIDGYEVCRRLKDEAITAAIPIIFVTANQAVEDEEFGLTLGAVDYITKPIHPAIVLARVNCHVTLKIQRDKLAAMALYDQLTGLHNRHYLLDIGHQKVAHSIRYQQPLSLLMIDIDHFKIVNDEFGHPAGDAILKHVAKSLRLESRKEDVAARWGGEEFLMLLDHCDIDEAMAKGQQLCNLIEQLNPDGIRVTVSIGVGALSKGETDLSQMLKRADVALYQAKEQGRNQVIRQPDSG